MKEILTKYLQSEDNWETIIVDYWNIDGANCEVIYYTDKSRYYKETKNINVWDMLMFLNLTK